MLLFRWWLRAAVVPVILVLTAGYGVTLFNEYRRRERPESRRRRVMDVFKNADVFNTAVGERVKEGVKEVYDYLSGQAGDGERHTVDVKPGKAPEFKATDLTAKESDTTKKAEAKPESFPESTDQAPKAD